MLEELRHHDGVLLADVCRHGQEALQILLRVAHIHGSTRKNVAGTHKYGETYALYERIDVVHRCERAPFGLIHANASEHSGEFLAIFGVVDVFSLRAEQRHALFVKTHRQVVRNLPAGAHHHAVGGFQIEDVQHAFVGEFVEIQAVAHVVVRRNRLGVVVDHHRTIPLFANRVECLHTTPVELYRRTNAIRTGTEDDYRTLVVFVTQVVSHRTIGEVKVVGLRRIFGGERIDLLHKGHNACLLAAFAHQHLGALNFHLAFHAKGACHLEIREALSLGTRQQIVVEYIDIAHGFQFSLRFIDIVEFTQEPTIDFREAVHIFYGVSVLKGLLDDKNALVCGRFEGSIDIFDGQFVISHEAVHALSDHAEAFLDHFFESAADRHHFTHRFHRTTEFAIHTTELTQVPTRDFAHHIVKCRFEEGRSGFRH